MGKVSVILAVCVIGFAVGASAQVNAGEASMNLNANLSAGYNDDYSNFGASDHGIGFGGTANLFGSYHNPNFLSFQVQPFYDQSRDNSTYQSLTSASGVSASTQLFTGTHYGGSISYSTVFNSSGNFGVPGLANYTTHGDSDVLAVNWGAHPEKLPSLNLSFSDANSAYSIYGISAPGTLHTDTFSASSAYQVAGFGLSGGYQHTGAQGLVPELLTGEPAQNNDTSANAFSFSVTHNLPWSGNFSAAASRLDLSTDWGETASSDRYNGSIDSFGGGVNFTPRTHLSVGANAFYIDNLAGTLYNTLVTSGVSVQESEGQQASNQLTLTAHANYEMPAQHLVLSAFAQREQQAYGGAAFASDSINGTSMYSNTLLGGTFNGVLGVTWTSINTSREALLGLIGSVNYMRHINLWTLTGAFGYSQDVQTVLIAYTTSGYTYSGSAGRRLGRKSYWTASASGARSLLTGQPGSANSSQSYSSSLALSRFSISGSYSISSGNALLTPTGLVATPVPLPVITPAAVVLFNGRSYSLGLGARPVRRLNLSASFSQALSNTQGNSIASSNNNETMNFLMTYNFRKMGFIAGYSRLVQGFSVTGTPPTLEGLLYVGVSRWFNFF